MKQETGRFEGFVSVVVIVRSNAGLMKRKSM